MEPKIKQPSLFLAFIPILFLISFIALNVYLFDKAIFEDTLGGANQTALLLAGAIAAVISTCLGLKWKTIRERIVKSISSTMPSIIILLFIGSLAGTWFLSGVVPALIYYGLQILNPTFFLVASLIVCAVVSLGTGSSWSTIATIGIALIGIGKTIGIHEGIVAGAIISGAYFGDKMSPLSDTTNLAPAMAGTDLFTHIRYMSLTTGPSMIITIIIFTIIGFNYNFQDSSSNVDTVLITIKNTFHITPWLFLVPASLIFIIIKKVPPIPSLFIGTIMGAIFAIIFQPDVVREISGGIKNLWLSSYSGVVKAIFGKISITTDNTIVNELFTTKGMAGMLNTVWLILSAMIFGGIMEAGGLLSKITQSIIKMAKSTGSLVASTATTCAFLNLTASDQYLAIVIPGRMYAKVFKDRGYKPELLSRTLEDSGTVTSVLVPWNTCGATQSSVLGVSVTTFLPYCFFNFISPLMTILYAYLNIKIRRINQSKVEKPKPKVKS